MGKLGTYTDRTAATITGPQLSFLTSLTSELWDLTARIAGDDVTADRARALALLPSMTKSAASDRIGSLKNEILPPLRATARALSYTAQTVEPPASAPAPVALDTEKIYVVAGRYYRVKMGRASGKPYALVLNTDTRRWDYAPGMAAKITPADVLTADHAARLPFSWCIRCAAELSDPTSIARRMGPICYRKSVG
jgi:hypothetical protein